MALSHDAQSMVEYCIYKIQSLIYEIYDIDDVQYIARIKEKYKGEPTRIRDGIVEIVLRSFPEEDRDDIASAILDELKIVLTRMMDNPIPDCLRGVKITRFNPDIIFPPGK